MSGLTQARFWLEWASSIVGPSLPAVRSCLLSGLSTPAAVEMTVWYLKRPPCGSIAAYERRQQLRPLWQQLPHWIGVLHGWVLRLRGRIHALPRGMRGFLFLFQRQFKLRQLRELVLDWRELLWRGFSQEYLNRGDSFVPGWVRVICESGD